MRVGYFKKIRRVFIDNALYRPPGDIMGAYKNIKHMIFFESADMSVILLSVSLSLTHTHRLC